MKKQRLNACLALIFTATVSSTAQAQEVASFEPAPNLRVESKPKDSQHQCYARVSVPAEYRTEKVKAELLPEIERFKVTPPVFKDSVETVIVSPATKKITAVQPVMEETKQKFEVMASSTQWVRGSLKGKQPLTKGELLDMKELGVNVDEVATGTCFYEHLQEATIQDIPTKILVSEATEKLSVSDHVYKDDVVSVTTHPAYTRVVEVPPTLKKGEERISTAAATKNWQTQCGAIQQVDHMTGETLCLVDVPEKFENVETELVDIPALLTKVENEAEAKDVKVKTLVTEAKRKREVVPAVYDSFR